MILTFVGYSKFYVYLCKLKEKPRIFLIIHKIEV